MIQLGNQYALLFFHPFALGHIDVHTDHAFCASTKIVREQGSRLDPSNLAVPTTDAILRFKLAPPLGENFAAECVKPRKIIGMHTGSPFVDPVFFSALRQAVYRHVARGNLYPSSIE